MGLRSGNGSTVVRNAPGRKREAKSVREIICNILAQERYLQIKKAFGYNENMFIFEILKKIGAFFLDLIETVVIALAIFVVVYLFLVQPHQVKGKSMYPNFEDGEYLLTDKVSYKLGQPKRGDVIVFKAPENEKYDYIKRIIGVPGDSVSVSGGHIYINGQGLEEDYLPGEYETRGGSFLREGQSVVVKDGEYFCVGDNRSHSSDSREWGMVPFENIIGRAWFRYWPPGRIGLLPGATYASD